MQANGDIERGLPSGTPAGLAWRPRGRDPTPGDWNLQYGTRTVYTLHSVPGTDC